MRILITNDDGFDAAGIKSLKKIALTMSTEDNVFVVAPSRNQSAKSRSITYKTDFEITKKNNNEYSVDGTPTDCVIFALSYLMKDKKPDLILSGINWGYNLAEDVFYSGTIAAAMEGADRGVLSIALSQAYSGAEEGLYPFLFAEKCSSKLCSSIYKNFSLLRKTIAFNVNFPANPKKRYPDCVKITPIGRRYTSNFAINNFCRNVARFCPDVAEILPEVHTRFQNNPMFGATNIKESNKIFVEELIEYVRQKSPLNVQLDNRINLKTIQFN